MFERIVVGTDGSETAGGGGAPSDRAGPARPARSSTSSAPTSRSRATRLREEAGEIPGDVAYAVGPQRGRQRGARGRRRPGAASAASRSTRTRARATRPTRSSTVAEEIGADLIVVGNKGMTGARRFLLGSVPNKISPPRPLQRLHRPHDLAARAQSVAAALRARRRALASSSPGPVEALRRPRPGGALEAPRRAWSADGFDPATPLAITSAATAARVGGRHRGADVGADRERSNRSRLQSRESSAR